MLKGVYLFVDALDLDLGFVCARVLDTRVFFLARINGFNLGIVVPLESSWECGVVGGRFVSGVCICSGTDSVSGTGFL